MIFTELRFLLFFVVAFAVHWSLRGDRARKAWLLLCSYGFYAAWDPWFLILIAASTLVDYGVGRRLGQVEQPSRRKRWLLVSLGFNLGLLGLFKYFDFFVASGVELLSWLGLPASPYTLGLILPVGISFYTFQTLSYSIDVYRRDLEPTRDLLDLALFVGFFPQLVAGPIVRASTFLPQLAEGRRWERVTVRPWLVLFLVGFFKKAVVSDGIAPFVDTYFASVAEYDGASAWIAVTLYTVQLYCDFSAYSDMAIASAGLLGYELCENFRFPYFAASITDFWRRWHMSLSSWLRDYLYYPLGGSRGTRWHTWCNLAVTWLLCGLWHGAHWRFVIFGGMMAPALALHMAWSRGPGRTRSLPLPLGMVLTYLYICLAQILFRAPDLATAGEVLAAFVTFEGGGARLLGDRLPWLFAGLVVLHALSARRVARPLLDRTPDGAFAWGYGAAWALVLTLTHPQAQPFVYFQF